MKTGHFAEIEIRGFGRIWVAWSSSGICRVALSGDKRKLLVQLSKQIDWHENDADVQDITHKMQEIAEGKDTPKLLKLDIRRGTPFQQRVWKTIATIPYGETRSYAWLAHAVGKPRAIRATANACGKNPLPLIIPCHRVIASDGSIGGFSGGIEIKKRLLGLEMRLTADNLRRPETSDQLSTA